MIWSYESTTIVNYDSRVVLTRKHLINYNSKVKLTRKYFIHYDSRVLVHSA